MTKQFWIRWGEPNPVHEAAGLRFDHEPGERIRAPAGRYRVCAFHVDFDERPTCYRDVDTLAQAEAAAREITEGISGWNVDFATAYDPEGAVVGSTCPWAQRAFG